MTDRVVSDGWGRPRHAIARRERSAYVTACGLRLIPLAHFSSRE